MDKNTFLLKLHSKEDLQYLISAGYDNIQNISYENLRVKIVVVDDTKKIIMPISVTCLAGMKIKPVDFNDFRIINELNASSCEGLES